MQNAVELNMTCDRLSGVIADCDCEVDEKHPTAIAGLSTRQSVLKIVREREREGEGERSYNIRSCGQRKKQYDMFYTTYMNTQIV